MEDAVSDARLTSKVRSHSRNGFFLTLEGPEGSGKSTQAIKIVRFLRGRGFAVVHTREPGGTAFGEALRKILLDPSFRDISPESEFFLYETIRSQHIQEKIRPALARGAVVVCERFSDASMAYQGFGRGLSLKILERIDRFATGGLVPDLTLLFDIPVEVGLKKALAAKKEFSKKGDRIEQAGLAFHRRVRRGYLRIARRRGLRPRFQIIPVTKNSTPEGAFEKVRGYLEQIIAKGNRIARRPKG